MRQLIGFAILLLATSARATYECGPIDTCSSGVSGYDRPDALGCGFFCYQDKDRNGELTLAEFQQSFNSWLAAPQDESIDLTHFTYVFINIIPICDNEAQNIFNNLAPLDGDASSVSATDIDSWYSSIRNNYGELNALNFQLYWRNSYATNGDPNCSRPY